jgi:UDP-4-amino-4,6-dideoxy-N-acetyl-beta-L-altrosamine N-acetyltransferase
MFPYKKIYMRPVEEKDLEKIRKIRNDPSTWMNLTHINLINVDDQKKWFASLSKQRTSKRFYTVCKGKEQLVGIVRMDEFDWVNRNVRVGCDVAKHLRGKGYGTQIMQMVMEYCFNYLNMHRLWLLVLENNVRAQTVYKKVGFKTEGRYRQAVYRNGQYYDYVLMSLLKGENR